MGLFKQRARSSAISHRGISLSGCIDSSAPVESDRLMSVGPSDMGQARKVLIVSRDIDLLMVLRGFLAEAGFDTMTTWAQKHALKYIESSTFDIVISEHAHRPHCSVEFLTKVRRKQPATLCIVLKDAPLPADEWNDLRSMGIETVISKWDLKYVVQTARALSTKGKSMVASAVG